MLRDRRGLGVAEYALMLFIVIAGVAIAYRFIGKSVKHAGNKTEEQFQGGSQGGSNNAPGNKTASNANSAGGSGAQAANTGGTSGGGGAAGGSGGGSGGANAGGGQNASSDTPGNAAGGEEDDTRGTPLWKIIGGVFVVLFGIGGYFAFRKQSKGG